MFTYWRRGVLWQGCGRQDKLRQTVLAFHHKEDYKCQSRLTDVESDTSRANLFIGKNSEKNQIDVYIYIGYGYTNNSA